ncbi:MAG: trypsin-like peptidase domain-containing protein [Deltaproteobacteria bacterium]|nr:trypsin-like peptidase domain-containing protein [Deltaproteobacteria bacterium]
MKRGGVLQTLLFIVIGVAAAYFASKYDLFGSHAVHSKQMPPRSSEEEQIIDVYKSTNEAVVFITTISVKFDLFSGVQPEEGTGSGVVIDPEKGIILTNFHVIENANHVEVALANGGVYSAKLLGIDPETDIAVLKLVDPPNDLVSIPFGDSNSIEVGQKVLAIGNPFGLNRTLTTGTISSLNRAIKRPDGAVMKGLVQTDASINVGNSGGPLLDKSGKLIGINSAILSRSGDSAGIGFAVPINQISRILPELIATGKVLRPDIGWILVDTDQGAMVHQIVPGGPADLAGVQPILRRVEGVFISGFLRDLDHADLIYAINGQRVTTKDQIADFIAKYGSRDKLHFELRQGGGNGDSRVVEITPIMR